MAEKASTLAKLDKRYVLELLEALEKRKNDKTIDTKLYKKLKETYEDALEKAVPKNALRTGFATLEALAPDPKTLKQSSERLLKHLRDLDTEYTKIEGRFDKLDELFHAEKISEAVYRSKQNEYRTLLSKIEDEINAIVSKVPEELDIIQAIYANIVRRMQEIDVEMTLEGSSSNELKEEKKALDVLGKSAATTAKDLAKVAKIDFNMKKWKEEAKSGVETVRPEDKVKAKITPLAKEVKTTDKTRARKPKEDSLPPPPEFKSLPVKWRGLQVGQYLGELQLPNGRYSIIKNTQPSNALVREIALTAPSRIKSSREYVVLERLQKAIRDEYGVDDHVALYPRHLIRYAADNKIGVDILKLILSYYGSIRKSALKINPNEAVVNDNTEILSLSENAGLLGRRVLAPDATLIGVVHELYLDPDSLELYLLAFKGVPPAIIRRLYRETHNRSFSQTNFGDFRNEIAKKLSIPIFEALTPSSILRYALYNGTITSFGSFLTLVENMNPRISKVSDVRAITQQGIRLNRYPQNILPKIEPFD